MTEEEKKTRLLKWAEVRHFTPEEFESPDAPGSGIHMNIEFIKLLDQGRAVTGFPWMINSGYRTLEHNVQVGGKGPEHCQGNAVDIAAGSLERFQIVKWAYSVGIKRIGIGKGFVHLGFSFELPQEVIWTYY